MKKKSPEKRSRLFDRPDALLVEESAAPGGAPPPIHLDGGRRRPSEPPAPVPDPTAEPVAPAPAFPAPIPPAPEEEELLEAAEDDGDEDGYDVSQADEFPTVIQGASPMGRVGVSVSRSVTRAVSSDVDYALGELEELVRTPVRREEPEEAPGEEFEFDAGVLDEGYEPAPSTVASVRLQAGRFSGPPPAIDENVPGLRNESVVTAPATAPPRRVAPSLGVVDRGPEIAPAGGGRDGSGGVARISVAAPRGALSSGERALPRAPEAIAPMMGGGGLGASIGASGRPAASSGAPVSASAGAGHGGAAHGGPAQPGPAHAGPTVGGPTIGGPTVGGPAARSGGAAAARPGARPGRPDEAPMLSALRPPGAAQNAAKEASKGAAKPPSRPSSVHPLEPRNDRGALILFGVLLGAMVSGGLWWAWPRYIAPPPQVASADGKAAVGTTPAPSTDATGATVAAVTSGATTGVATTPAATGSTPTAEVPPGAATSAVPSPSGVPATGTTTVASTAPTTAATSSVTRPGSAATTSATSGAAASGAASTTAPKTAATPTKATNPGLPTATTTAGSTSRVAAPVTADAMGVESGYLRVVSDRKCLVIVDGRQRGYAPALGLLELPAGEHSLKCVVAGAGTSRSTTVRVDSGALREAELRFED